MTLSNYTSPWDKVNPVVVGTTAFCLAYFVLVYLVPSHYTWFELHRNVTAFFVLLLSVIIFPFGFFSMFAGEFQITLTLAALLYYFSFR